jgi:hypothetical protein
MCSVEPDIGSNCAKPRAEMPYALTAPFPASCVDARPRFGLPPHLRCLSVDVISLAQESSTRRRDVGFPSVEGRKTRQFEQTREQLNEPQTETAVKSKTIWGRLSKAAAVRTMSGTHLPSLDGPLTRRRHAMADDESSNVTPMTSGTNLRLA